MSQRPSKEWLARATTQFARTVYSELRRAGHGKSDIVRFVNELMDLLTNDVSPAGQSQQPELVDPEAGLPDAETMHDLLEFELRVRPPDRRQDEKLAVAAIDVILPSWTSATARQRTHVLLADAFKRERRAADTIGQLGPDRYLLVLPRSKSGVRASVEGRISQALETIAPELADGLTLELRWTSGGATVSSAVELLAQCFVSVPSVLRPSSKARLSSSEAISPPHPVPAAATRELVLALGGGAARAVSHAGVLQVLATAGIRPIAVSGCSAGALVGAMFARGVDPDTIVARFSEFTTTPIYRAMRAAYADFLRRSRAGDQQRRSRPRYFGASSLAFYSDATLSILSNELLGDFVEHFIGADCDIAALPIPFSVVTTDLVLGRAVNLAHGSLRAALAASCAVPGLFPPQQMGERLLVDGATITEVPIWSAHLFGLAAPVLSIYMGRPFHRIADYRTSTEVSTRASSLVHAELVREQLRRADLLLTIPMEEVGWLDFRQARRIAELGRQAAIEALPSILAALDRSQRPSGGVGVERDDLPR